MVAGAGRATDMEVVVDVEVVVHVVGVVDVMVVEVDVVVDEVDDVAIEPARPAGMGSGDLVGQLGLGRHRRSGRRRRLGVGGQLGLPVEHGEDDGGGEQAQGHGHA